MNELHSVPSSEAPAEESTTSSESPIEADDLIEEVSIDGMCGVY